MTSFLKTSFFLLLFVAGFQTSNGQETIKGKITDEKGQVMRYATVSYFNRNVGTYTDSLGRFTIRKIDCDTLLVSHMGYKIREILVHQAIKDTCTHVILESDNFVLDNIDVVAKKAGTKFGKKVTFENGDVASNKSSQMYYGSLSSIYFDDIVSPCRIDKVSFYVHKVSNDDNRLRIRFFAVDSLSHKPSYELNNEEIIISHMKSKSWVHANLKKYHVILSCNAFFVVLESMSDGKDNSSGKNNHRVSSDISISSVETKNTGYKKFFNNKWKSQAEQIGDKEIAKSKRIQYYEQLKEKELKGITDKDRIEALNKSLDDGLKNSLDLIDGKWNFVPYIKIDVRPVIQKR